MEKTLLGIVELRNNMCELDDFVSVLLNNYCSVEISLTDRNTYIVKILKGQEP
jgi:hypothetical protein